MGFANVPPAVSDGSSQLVGQTQSRYCHQGIKRGRAELTARTWAGHLWRGLTAQEEEGRRPTQRSTRRGWDFPTCFTVSGSTQAALAKGQGQKLNFQSLPRQGLGKLLLSGSGHTGMVVRPEMFIACQAHSWTEVIELDQLLVMGSEPWSCALPQFSLGT